jgi:hypothetical protein
MELKLNGTYQLLVYSDDVNLFRVNINIKKLNIEALVGANNTVDLKANTEKTKDKLISSHQNCGQSKSIKIAHRSFENAAKLIYSGKTGSNQKLIHDEIKSRFNSVNVCYHAVQNVMSSRLLPKNIKIKIYATIILPTFMCLCVKLVPTHYLLS